MQKKWRMILAISLLFSLFLIAGSPIEDPPDPTITPSPTPDIGEFVTPVNCEPNCPTANTVISFMATSRQVSPWVIMGIFFIIILLFFISVFGWKRKDR